MLNETCQFEDPSYILLLQYLFGLVSIPIFLIAFWVLIFKCPPRFKAYRNLVLLQILSGILLEFHVAIIWRVSVPLPWAILCSHGIASEYSVACFEALIALLTLNGVTSLSLFFYRMEAASQHAAHSLLHKIVNFLKFSFYFMILVVAVLSILIYPVLKDQTGYKIKQNIVFKLKGFMWCDSCIFMPLDSELFILWFVIAYLTITLAFVTGISAAVVTYDSLKISHNKLSPGIIAIQKNFFVSLIASVITHLSLLFIPLSIYFLMVGSSSFSMLVPKETTHFLLLMIHQHGSVSALTMLLTNNLLRKAIKQSVWC